MIESVRPRGFFSLDMWPVLECRRARPDTLRGEMWRMEGWELLEGEERGEARHMDLHSRLGSLITDTWRLNILLARVVILENPRHATVSCKALQVIWILVYKMIH